MASKVKKGINVWSFPDGMSIEDCMKLAKEAGFEGMELALAAEGPLSLESSDEEIISYRKKSEEIGIVINSLATGLYWQFSLTSDRADIREKAKSLVKRQLEIASLLGADCILVSAGTVGVDFAPDEVVPDAHNIEFYTGSEVIDYDVAWQRSQEALKELAPFAERAGVYIGLENMWNKFLLSPIEMRTFIDEIDSPWVQVFLDVANMMPYGYPQHWIKILGKRIKKVHFKDYRRGIAQLTGFVDLLSGDVDWVEVIDALDEIDYDGWANAEMTPVYKNYPEQIVYNSSMSMDRILRRK